MSIRLSDRIAIINGFVVDKVEKKVISRSNAKYAKLCQEYIRDKEVLREMPGQLSELDKSNELFQFITCKMYEFNIM